jgi:hypothetical protein
MLGNNDSRRPNHRHPVSLKGGFLFSLFLLLSFMRVHHVRRYPDLERNLFEMNLRPTERIRAIFRTPPSTLPSGVFICLTGLIVFGCLRWMLSPETGLFPGFFFLLTGTMCLARANSLFPSWDKDDDYSNMLWDKCIFKKEVRLLLLCGAISFVLLGYCDS